MTNPTASDRSPRRIAEVRAKWPTMTRRARRAAARWWWCSCTRTAPSWPEQWRLINEASGIVQVGEVAT